MMNMVKNRLKNNDGFMGPTHAMSAVAFYLLLFLFFKDFILNLGLKDNLFILFISSLVVAGSALFPDLDNTKSTAMSVLGIVGEGISSLMRSSATIIFYLTRTKYDDEKANPHRGFWHTLIASLLLGLLVKFTVELKIPISNDFLISYNYNKVGDLFALFWIFITIQLAFSGLMNSFVKKMKKSFVNMILLSFIGMILSGILVYYNSSSYNWLIVIMILGYIFHIIGDTMTVAGTPVLFPIKFKGKRWFTHRILKIHAGGEFETNFLLPLFSIIVIVCSILIIINSFK